MIKLYNSLSRSIEDFKPIHDHKVGLYTCGPTVYNFVTIGNFRTYTLSDILIRVLKYNGFDVDYIMNITDVGHLTGDNLGDASQGEDRLEKASKNEGKTAWEVAEFYTEIFFEDYEKLNLIKPRLFAKATDHIKEQIQLISKLEERGFTYQIADGIYFDTEKFPSYGELSNLDEIKEGARVEANPDKKNPRDFALWKFSPTQEKRQMEWNSPWGKGFPGWHIECSAMSMKYLGKHFDIHTGGMDLKSTHHPNEIAQSEAATGEKFVNYWVHGAFMLVQGQKMSKSLANTYRLYDIAKEGYEPLALRYLYLQTHYRQEMNFTYTSLEAAQNALAHLRQELAIYVQSVVEVDKRSKEKQPEISSIFGKQFLTAINDDLNMPEALAAVWEMVKSDEDPAVKATTLLSMDKVLGLGLQEWLDENKSMLNAPVPPEVKELVEIRNQLRKERRFSQADQVRNQIKRLGYDIEDTQANVTIKKLSNE